VADARATFASYITPPLLIPLAAVAFLAARALWVVSQ
jgi:hypothetical protein